MTISGRIRYLLIPKRYRHMKHHMNSTDEGVAIRRRLLVLLSVKVTGHLDPYHPPWLNRCISVEACHLEICFAPDLLLPTPRKAHHPIHILIHINIPICTPVNIHIIHHTHISPTLPGHHHTSIRTKKVRMEDQDVRLITQVLHNSRGSSVPLIVGNRRRRDRLICPLGHLFL